jgi:crotonobetainyl-CoA:carnitine CoA-transferase CaiB-like acyl-CoA transferase
MSFEPGQLANDLQMQARGYFRTVDSDEFGAVRLPGRPFRSEPELLTGGGPAPARGADTERLLAELGVPDGALDEWRRAGVI